jgi:hypothetical protein
LDAEDRYSRQCPVHGLTLQAKELPEGYRNRAHPELECPQGHLVGVDCEVNYWNVCHVETGQVVYEADEEGYHQVKPRILVVEPDDLYEPVPLIDRVDPRVHDPANWVSRNRKNRPEAA